VLGFDRWLEDASLCFPQTDSAHDSLPTAPAQKHIKLYSAMIVIATTSCKNPNLINRLHGMNDATAHVSAVSHNEKNAD
jgi:hypothetical protein